MTNLTRDLAAIVRCLKSDGVIAYPTEGVFGLGCDAANQQSCERIIELKGRDPLQGLITLVSDWQQLNDWIKPLTSAQLALLEQPRPQATTWLIPASPAAPQWLTGRFSSLAVRKPDWQPLLQLCEAFGHPLVSTSANPHGCPAVTSAAAVQAYFADAIELIWDHDCGQAGAVSRIVDLISGQVLRSG